MGRPQSEQAVEALIDRILGYLNFSSGNHDKVFFENLNQLFRQFTDSEALKQKILASRCKTVPRRANCQTKEAKKSLIENEFRISLQQLFADYDQDPFKSQLATEPETETESPTLLAFQSVHQALKSRIEVLQAEQETFRDATQARKVIRFVFEVFVPAYLNHHRDLLFHQNIEILFNSFFIARVFETALAEGNSHENESTLLRNVLGTLNDHIGHRPIATLESQKIEPYSHEFIRPIPLYVAEVGTACGPYESLIESAIDIIKTTSESILRRARFDPNRLDELSIDPRAFDFDHPVNKRPNHHFGSWDEQEIDSDGYFRRFIVHQVALDALLERIDSELKDEESSTSEDELLTEAAAVLACTILMSSAISGDFVGAYDSNMTLGDLLPVIAGYRDEFYDEFVGRLTSAHRERIHEESRQRHQPFGAVRQSLNSKLAQHRASQLVNCRLASIFARMGFPDAARLQLEIVPVASARIICQIDCLLAAATQAINAGELDDALAAVPRMVELLKRGIHCGAIIDPWNIIGFDANYSLFPALENSVRDHRAYDLVDLIESIMAICSRLWSEAAADDRQDLSKEIRTEFLAIVDWWRKYAAYEVMSVDAVDPQEISQAAELVATALNLWHKGGAAAGDIGFWSEHAQLFDSPKAYTLVIDALMQRGDFKTTTALLVHWLSQAGEIELQQGDSSFHNLMFRWMSEQKRTLLEQLDAEGRGEIHADKKVDEERGKEESEAEENSSTEPTETPDDVWNRIRKFYDFIEANAEQYWQVPEFQLNRKPSSDSSAELVAGAPGDDESDDEDNVYKAAYEENFVYRDSTNDGFEGEVFDDGQRNDDALEAEVDRVLNRLEFLGTMSSFWRIAATIPLSVDRRTLKPDGISDSMKSRLQKRREIASNWVRQADKNRQDLIELLNSINQYKLPKTSANQESMLLYDQHRLYKESLLDQAINTCVGTENAVRALLAVVRAIDTLLENDSKNQQDDAIKQAELNTSDEASPLICVLAGFLLHDRNAITERFHELVEYLEQQPILYVPLSKGGSPEKIVEVRVVQTAILDLLRTLPKMGLFTETFIATRTALRMERMHPVALGAVSEFDELFKVAYTSMVSALVASTNDYQTLLAQDDTRPEAEVADQAESVLFDCVEMLTESILILWLDHSKTLRLSVMEKVIDTPRWNSLVNFIKRYGEGLFTQYFLHLGNIGAILHQGVDHWLTQVEESDEQPDLALFDDLGKSLPREEAVSKLTIVFESVIENYNEYRDYNTTTTQSDSGELLFLFLDFLRLRTKYDRVCWNLKPVVWAHKILVQKQHNGVGRMWRRSLNDRIGPEAQKYLDKLAKLQKEYSIEMQSVSRQIEGRFGAEMQIDRLTSQVKLAMANPPSQKSHRAFDLLQSEAQTFSRTTMGVGIDLPAWLAALENEVQQMHLPARLKTQRDALYWRAPEPTRIADLREQLEELPRRD